MICPMCITAMIVTNAPAIAAAAFGGMAAVKLSTMPQKQKRNVKKDEVFTTYVKSIEARKSTRPEYYRK